MASSFTVSQINKYIKNMFLQDFVLNKVSVTGELSNCKYHPSGHLFFTLKDANGTLPAIMYASQVKNLEIQFKDGMKVIVHGRIDIFERDGKYQLYANRIEMNGIGELYKQFEALKIRFEQMGYFSSQYKRPIPKYACKIGIVTASSGAAIQDIINISHRRNPYVSLILYPALVQGSKAAKSIVKGIEKLNLMELDVIIIGRGGGSIEDLWAFNEEMVAEAIFNSNTPIISAVGHETDFTIADFVADLRAPTPSAAAELAVSDIRVAEAALQGYLDKLKHAMYQRMEKYYTRLEAVSTKLKYLNPQAIVDEKRHYLCQIREQLDNLIALYCSKKRHELELYASRLQGVSPLEKLGQGYSYTETIDGNMVKSVKDIKVSDCVNIYVKDGCFTAMIHKITENGGNSG